MNFTKLAAILGGAALLATATVAQAQQSSVELVQVEDDDRQVEQFNISVDDLEGMSIVGPDDETIGDVSEVLMTREGEITAVSVGVGGFLGIGERNAVIELDSLNYNADDEELQLDMTREEIEQLPEWGE